MRITPAQAQAKLRKRADQAFRALVLEASKRIVLRTPVDTGRARGNWHLARGSPDLSTTESTDGAGGRTISTIMAKLQGMKGGDAVFLTNALAYIISLEHGHSKQAPAGMVKVTIAELQSLAREVATRLRAAHGE